MVFQHLRSACLPCAALVAGLLVCAAPSASAISGKQFVALRKQKHYERAVSYARVQADPASYVGHVLELRGTVGGVVSCGDTVTMMLSMADNSAPLLELPASEADILREFQTPVVRVLVQVKEGGSGNVVPLKVLALAHDSEVLTVETEEAARAAAVQRAAERRRAERERWQREADRSVRWHGSYGPSRGDLHRGMPSGASSVASYLSPRARPLFEAYYNYIGQVNPRLGANATAQITYNLLNFADRYNVDPRLVVAMIIAESGFDPNATSRTGAMGLGQLMPGTARALGVSNAYDPAQNLDGCINYLRSRLDTFADKAGPGGGITFEQVALALAAYNAGANAVKKYGGVPPYRETQAYVRRVIGLYRQLSAGH